MTAQDAARQALKISGLAADITDRGIDEILASSKIRRLRLSRGEIVFHDGDKPTCLYILLSGEVHILKDTFSGRCIFISEVNALGDLFGEIYMVLGKPYDIYVEASDPCEILAISSEYFSVDGGESKTALLVQRNLMRIFARKAYYMHSRIKVLASGSLRERIVRFLFQNMNEKGEVYLNITREYLAAYLAVTRPSISRELSAMQKDGILIVRGKQVVVRDMEKFEEYL